MLKRGGGRSAAFVLGEVLVVLFAFAAAAFTVRAGLTASGSALGAGAWEASGFSVPATVIVLSRVR